MSRAKSALVNNVLAGYNMLQYMYQRLLIFLCLLVAIRSQTPANLDDLMTSLQKNYNPRIRPVQDQMTPVLLDVSMFLFSINEVDEVNKRLVTTGFLELIWRDELFRWDASQWNNTRSLYVPQDYIWKPDLVLKNGFTRFQEMGGVFYYVLVEENGSVLWKPYEVFETRCSIDITNFPYDKQTCGITFIVWSYSFLEVNIQKSSKGINFYEYEENSMWTIVDTDSFLKTESTESEITFTITIQRKPQYYVINMILPIVCLGFLNVLVFVLPSDAGEKMSYSVTVFLSFAVFLTLISAELPANSDSTSILSLYLVFQMVIGFCVLVISSIQLRLHHRKNSKDMARIFLGIVRTEQCLRCQRKCCSPRKVQTCFVEKYIENEKVKGKIEWHDVTSAIDFLCFWIFVIVNTGATLVLFLLISSP